MLYFVIELRISHSTKMRHSQGHNNSDETDTNVITIRAVPYCNLYVCPGFYSKCAGLFSAHYLSLSRTAVFRVDKGESPVRTYG